MMENNQLNLFDVYAMPLFSSLHEHFPNNEYEELEYKAATGGFPEDFWKTYSAFANSNGGLIVLGIKEHKNTMTIQGLEPEKINKYKKTFWDSVNNPQTVNTNLLLDKDVQQVTVEGKLLLVFKIPAAKRTQKPVHLTRNPFENTYKRNHEGDYKCTKEEVRRMLADADGNVHPDSRILEGFSIEDIDLSSLKRYRQLFGVAKSAHPWLTLDDKEFLTKLGGYRQDRVTKQEGFTVAGLLMFGKESSIIDKECVPNFFPDFREVLTTDPNVRWTDRIYPDGTWEANLFQFYLKIWPRLSSSLPKPFQLKEGVRQDETPAHVALREAFVNALIHTDYSAPGNLVIEHKTDIFQFSNPGTLLVSLHQYYQGGISECRNPSIQKMFLMIGSAEKAGSGVNKIMAGWEYAHWRTPYLQIYSQPDRLVLELPMFSILPEETLSDLRNMFGPEIDALGKDELTILATCQIEGEITNSRLQYMIDRHRTDITKILQDLCRQGYLVSDNRGRWTSYRLNSEFAGANIDTSGPNIGTPVANLDTSGPNLDTSVTNLDTSVANLDTSGPNIDTSIANLDTSGLNIDTSELQGKKLSKSKMEQKIISLCKDDFMTLEEIAEKLSRKPGYIQNFILPSMIKEGKLIRQYPETINHPNQAYKSAAI